MGQLFHLNKSIRARYEKYNNKWDEIENTQQYIFICNVRACVCEMLRKDEAYKIISFRCYIIRTDSDQTF